MPSAQIERDGRIRIPLPDAPQQRPFTSHQFTFSQNRDVWTYAEEMMAAVEEFIDELLSAFEDNLPERFRRFGRFRRQSE